MNTINTKVTVLLFCWLLLNQAVLANTGIAPQSMIVITVKDKPLQQKPYAESIVSEAKGDFAVYHLNAVNDFEARFSLGLPKNEVEAKQLFQQRLAKVGKKNFKQQLLVAYQGLLTAMQYPINRYPAIIFDQRLVVYGVTDLKVAIQHYRQWVLKQKNVAPAQGTMP